MVRLIALYIIVLQLISCSFQFPQYEFVKNIIIENQKQNQNKPEKNWKAFWLDKTIDFYAINFNNEIIFADEIINIFFRDNQIYKITGLEPFTDNLQIDYIDSELIYRLNEIKLGVDNCEKRNKQIDIYTKESIISQNCINSINGHIYTNQIWLNSDNLIYRMIIKLHPSYPSMELIKK